MRSKTSQAGILLSLVLVLLLSAGCLSSVKEIQQGFSDKLARALFGARFFAPDEFLRKSGTLRRKNASIYRV